MRGWKDRITTEVHTYMYGQTDPHAHTHTHSKARERNSVSDSIPSRNISSKNTYTGQLLSRLKAELITKPQDQVECALKRKETIHREEACSTLLDVLA